MFQCSLFVVSVFNFGKLQIFFLCFSSSSKSTTRNTELVRNIFIRPTLFKSFQCFVLYFQSHFMMLPFRGDFHRVSDQHLNSNKFQDFKTFQYYGIRIETFELTTAEYRRMKKTRLRNQNSNYMMSRRPKSLFNLDDFSNNVSSN